MSDAIPTTGPMGVNFRSRLEARWAQFFTLLRWPWQYEPDLGLSQWIADFALLTGKGLLVEVKPSITLLGLNAHKRRIELSGTMLPVWLTGVALALTAGKEPALGLFGFSLPTTWLWREMTTATLTEQIERPCTFAQLQRHWLAAGNDLQWRKV